MSERGPNQNPDDNFLNKPTKRRNFLLGMRNAALAAAFVPGQPLDQLGRLLNSKKNKPKAPDNPEPISDPGIGDTIALEEQAAETPPKKEISKEKTIEAAAMLLGRSPESLNTLNGQFDATMVLINQEIAAEYTSGNPPPTPNQITGEYADQYRAQWERIKNEEGGIPSGKDYFYRGANAAHPDKSSFDEDPLIEQLRMLYLCTARDNARQEDSLRLVKVYYEAMLESNYEAAIKYLNQDQNPPGPLEQGGRIDTFRNGKDNNPGTFTRRVIEAIILASPYCETDQQAHVTYQSTEDLGKVGDIISENARLHQDINVQRHEESGLPHFNRGITDQVIGYANMTANKIIEGFQISTP